MDCFICCTSTGKTDSDITNELFLNRRTFDYPIIKLSQAYGCACSNTYAHNKCLLDIKKCPTCRKVVVKPNLYVQTRYDHVFSWLFNKIKTRPYLISNIKTYTVIIVIVSFGLFFAIEKNIIKLNPSLKTHIGLGLLLFVQLCGGIIFLMQDYFAKYWLYDEKKNIIRSI